MFRVSLSLLLLPLLGCEPAADPLLHTLAERGETVPLLQAISDSSDINQRDVCYRTPLMLAAQSGHEEAVRALIASGAHVGLHEKGNYSALMLAAGNGHTRVVGILAAAGAAVDGVELTRGWTPLIWAAKRGHGETVQLLLELGADPAVADRQGRTARDWALRQGHAELAALL